MKFVVVIVILQLMLTCSQFSAGQPQDEGGEQTVQDITSAQCQTLHVLMVYNSSTGMRVTLTSTVNNTVETLSEKNLLNSYLPPECGANYYRCSILRIERSETSYYIVPSIGGFFILSYGTNHMGEEELQMDTSFVAISEKCNPIKAFYNGNYVVVACMDLPIESSGKLFYLRYDFSTPTDTMRSSILTKTTNQSDTIYNTETVSEVIFLTEQSRCQSTSNLYFIDDAYVVHSPSRLFSKDFVSSTEELQDCVGYLENFRDDIIVIRCTNNQTVLYDTCRAGNFDYQPRDHIPYPCSSRSMIAYRNRTQVSLNRNGEVSVTETLPFEDISYGRCIQGADRPVFIASSADGAIFITRFDGNNFTKITSGNNSGACFRPVFSENELVFGTCDSKSDSFVIVNMTEGCTDDPVIAQIPIPSKPDLVSVSLGQGTYNCSCSATQAIELPSTTQTESVAQTEGSTSPMANMLTVESDAKTTAATKPAGFSTWHERGAVLGLLSFVAVSIGLTAIFVFIIVCHKCRRARRRHTKTQEILNPNTESHQESHITAGSPRHFNIGLGGPGNCISRNGCCGQCESGNTTTNTSLSEFNLDEMPSCAGEQASCCEESVLNGGGHILSNSGGLPYASSQLTPPTLHDHHQQRTLNNDTAVTVEYFESRSR